jgi:drug/metabolite transporter (DMT)-like permease
VTSVLALTASVLFGLGDFGGGLAARRLPPLKVVAWSQVFGLPVLVIGLLVVPAPSVGWADLAWGAAAGATGLVGLVLLYSALAEGTMSVVAPITGAVAAGVPVIVDIVGGTRLTGTQTLGVVTALASIVLLSGMGRGSLTPALAVRAATAGVGLAGFAVAIAQTPVASGVWPLVGARGVSITLALALAAGMAGGVVGSGSIRLLALVGVLDQGANVAMALAIQRGPLGIVAVLSSLYPAVTVLTAIAVLRERPGRGEVLGICLAGAAVVLLV